jgi:hypothetical protein
MDAISHLVAQVQSSGMATPVNILFGAVSSLTAALVALYRDCRNDRATLWAHVRNLEDKLGVRPPPPAKK